MSATFTAIAPEDVLALAPADERALHLVRAGEYPRALCGFIVTDDFDPSRRDTAGRDRCADCLKINGGSL